VSKYSYYGQKSSRGPTFGEGRDFLKKGSGTGAQTRVDNGAQSEALGAGGVNAVRATGTSTKRQPRGTDRRLGTTDEDLITRIAWYYYKEKMTQQEIAEHICLSRQKVQRLLEKARDLEIIQFTLKHPYMNLLGVESELRKRYCLKDAVVAPCCSQDPERRRQAFAMAGAAYLERKLGTVRKGILGIGWGNTTAYLADYFDPQSIAGKVEVVSLIGNLMMNVSMNPYIMAEKMARRLGASFYNIWAPAIAQTKERADVFKSEPWIEEVLDIGARADIILISIGEASKSASLFKMGYLSPVDLQRLIGKGAVGDILCRYFDEHGEFIADEVHDRVIGIPMEAFRDQRKLIICVAGGPSKVKAIHAALQKKYINVLITDDSTAEKLLEIQG
jgi:lsr operon transcriptional repressor